MVFQGRSSLSMCRSLTNEKRIRRNMNDWFQILSEDIESQIYRMMHFSSAFRHLLLSRYVELAKDTDSRKSIYQYSLGQKISVN